MTDTPSTAAPRLVLCDCLGSQAVDPASIEAGAGIACGRVHRALCVDGLGPAAGELAAGGWIACGQETARLTEMCEALGLPEPGFVDIRDRAGWSEDAGAGRPVGPKQAALVADAALARPATRALDVVSGGLCLVLGPAEAAIPAAERLCGALAVTAVVPDASGVVLDRRYDVAEGRIHGASGTMGRFAVEIDALRELVPGGRVPGWGPPRSGARSNCDLILDLRGETPLFPAHEKRDGYLRPDPRDPRAVADALLQAVQMVGTFEKPLHLRYEPALCAHSRAGKPACSKCLDVCPTSAIMDAGDVVAIDPLACAGCGACAALCPSGAIAYDDPPVDHLWRRLDAMARAYRAAGGAAPRLLVHDDHGLEAIALAARHGRGLPADVVPLGMSTVSGFGHAEMLGALGAGFAAVDVALAPRSDRETLGKEAALAGAIAGPGRVRLLEVADPDALSDDLYEAEAPAPLAEPILPIGTRRQVTRTVARALHPGGAPIALPDHAPYGAVLVDTDACTLCLACVSLCPSGALMDNPDLPQLLFQEEACLQCGLCANVCPEDAITYERRLDPSDAALSQRVLNEEEPAACVECGALFGVQSTIDRIVEKLAGRHPMFASGEAARMIRMCDDCRVRAQFGRANPMAAGDRPAPRTSDDYFGRRRDH